MGPNELSRKTIEGRLRERWEHPDPDLLAEIESASWTAHNIPLTVSSSTRGGGEPLIGEQRRTHIIKDHLRFLLGDALPGKRLLDLGCLEGGLSFEMAREGLSVLGVEGRRANYEKCRLIERYYDFLDLRFLHLDVKALNRREHGVFDLVLCCGLLYHLESPVEFISTLNDITHADSILFLDTHVAPADQDLADCILRDRLSELVTVEHDGRPYQGRWYREYPDRRKASGNPWASVSNPRSLWLTLPSLLQALYRGGFDRIYEIHGGFDIDRELDLKKRHSRLYFLASKQNKTDPGSSG